jgi:hypothetical protein
MSSVEIHENGKLKLEVRFESQRMVVKWLGESKDREPIQFISPLFERLYQRDSSNPILLDFTELSYLNSSTVTPIVKQLEKARKANRKMEIRYSKSLKWQDLSFSALKVFAIPGLIDINGV